MAIRELIPVSDIERQIFLIRGHKVMIDRDLAELYRVTTGNLNLAVKRNKKRFPDDFVFQVTKGEFQNLILQSAISRWGGIRKMPYVFTEQGVAMLSSVLHSETAIDVNIQIIRIFTKMRELLSSHKDILLKLEKLEKKLMKQDARTNKHEEEIGVLFEAIKQLVSPASEPRKRIGYKLKGEE